MIQSFRQADFDHLAEFWNTFFPERYRIDAALLRARTVECPAFDWGASGIEFADGEVLGYVIVKAPATRLYRGPDRDSAHLSALAYRDPAYGIDLMAGVKRLLRNRGTQRLIFGADATHFFPGTPTDCPTLQGFLMVEGFEGSQEVVDLERDLADYQNPAPIPDGAEFRRLDPEQIGDLENFLRREFPGRWTYDVMAQVALEGPETVVGLIVDGRVEGFALIQDSRQRRPIGGAVWRADLGESWGSLGPIGVSKAVRGRGLGDALLGASLEILRDAGARRTIIDWTTLVDFYGRHGFVTSRTYRPMSLKLSE